MKNRWLIAASAVGIHLCIGSVYAWSVFNLPLENAFGWTKSDIAITFSLAIFFLGMSAAVLGHFVERYGPRTSGMVAAAFWGPSLSSHIAIRKILRSGAPITLSVIAFSSFPRARNFFKPRSLVSDQFSLTSESEII